MTLHKSSLQAICLLNPDLGERSHFPLSDRRCFDHVPTTPWSLDSCFPGEVRTEPAYYLELPSSQLVECLAVHSPKLASFNLTDCHVWHISSKFIFFEERKALQITALPNIPVRSISG